MSEASSTSLPAGTLALTIDLGIPDGLTLQLGNEQFPFSNASSQDGTSIFWSSSGLSWSVADEVTLRLSGEAPPTVTVADATATEGDAVEFVVTLSAVSGRDVMVEYATSETDPQSAVSGTDFTSTSGMLTIAAADNTATGTIQVPTTEDDASESAETFTLTLSNPTNATLGTPSAATGTINDDDGTPLSTDATLSDLSLGTGVMSPAFASGTDTYTASVANSVDEVTVTPTTNHASATAEILDTDNLALTDADSTEDGFQVALSVGSTQLGVLVTAEDGTTTKFYTVNVTRDDCPEGVTTTCEVDVGGSVTGNISSRTDFDGFRVDLEADTRYQIDLEGEDTGRGTLPDPVVDLYDGDGSLETDNETSGVGDNARVIYTPTETGTYYVVTGEVDGETGTYTLSVIVLGANGASEADTDFPSTTATTGRVEVGASVTGNMDRGSDFDWFRVDLEAGKTYQIDLEGSPTGRGSLGDPLLQIYDASGSNKLAQDDDSGGTDPNAQIVYTATATGAHYLTAQTLLTGDTGTYTLSVRDITQPSCTLETGDIWCGVLTVGELKTSADVLLAHGFSGVSGLSAGALVGNPDDTMFSVGDNDYTIQGVYIQVPTAAHLTGIPFVLLNADLSDDDKAVLVLTVDDTILTFAFGDATEGSTTGQYSWGQSGLDWSSATTVTLRLRGATAANNAPSFSSSASRHVAENTTAVVTVTASDADTGDDVTGYEITGGADQALFEIGATTGVLTFKTAPNFEDPQDSGPDKRLCGNGAGDQRHGHAGDDRGPDDYGDGDRRGHGGAGQAGGADGVGGVGDQPDGELVGAVQRGSAHYGLRRAAPDILAGGLVDGEERPVHRGGDREPIGEHLLRRAGTGNQRRGHRRVVGLGQRHDGRGGGPADAERRRRRGRRGRRRGVHGDADGGGLGEGDGDLDGLDRERRHGGRGGSRDDEDGGRWSSWKTPRRRSSRCR